MYQQTKQYLKNFNYIWDPIKLFIYLYIIIIKLLT